MTERLLTARELAEYLAVTENWVLDHAAHDGLPKLQRRKGQTLRFKVSEVEEWMRGEKDAA